MSKTTQHYNGESTESFPTIFIICFMFLNGRPFTIWYGQQRMKYLDRTSLNHTVQLYGHPFTWPVPFFVSTLQSQLPGNIIGSQTVM